MQDKLTIDIVSPSDEAYAQHLAVMIASVLYNSKEDEAFNFYILDSGISKESKKKIEDLRRIKYFSIKYLKGVNPNYKFCPLPNKHVINTYYRFEIPSLIPNLDKVLLLDSDLIVRGSLREFWETDLEGMAIGAIENPFSAHYPKRLKYLEKYGYFNAGVALMDLKKLREIDFEEKCFDFVKKHPERIWHVDQCVINSILYDKWKRLPYRYNFMSVMPLEEYLPEHYGLVLTPAEEVEEGINNALVAHFISDNKPWEYMSKRLFKDDYHKYLKMTLWKNAKPKDYTIGNILIKNIFSDKNLEIVRKFLGKKAYYFMQKILNHMKKTKNPKVYDKFKRDNPQYDEFKISLGVEIEGYIYIDDLDVFSDESWDKWFMTNTITQIAAPKDILEWLNLDSRKKMYNLIYEYLKYNGIFTSITPKGKRVLLLTKNEEKKNINYENF